MPRHLLAKYREGPGRSHTLAVDEVGFDTDALSTDEVSGTRVLVRGESCYEVSTVQRAMWVEGRSRTSGVEEWPTARCMHGYKKIDGGLGG